MTLTKEVRSTKTLKYIYFFVSMCVGITAKHLDIASEDSNGPLVRYYCVILSSPLEGSQAIIEADI